MISIRTHIREALRQLCASKLRAFLAVLGILVGTASVVAMVSIGQLAENQILSQFKQLGINLLSVSIYPENNNASHSANPYANLSVSSANKLVSISDNIISVAPYINSYGGITFKGRSLQQGSAIGITPAIYHIAKLYVSTGRRLSFLDKNQYYCLVGYSIAKTLSQWVHAPLIGQQITVGKTVFTIVGTLAKWPASFFFNADFNHAILVPITTAIAIQKDAQINNLAITIHHTNSLEKTEKIIQNYITEHTIQQKVSIHSPKQLIDSMKQSANTMTLLLGLIGSISLIVGGIGVMNIMLVSVAERRREIGIRLAIGAQQRDIQMQFLVESITLSVCGGIGGMIIGIIVTYVVALYSHWQFAFFVMPPTVGALVSVAVGIFFGFYPAKQAAKLDPIQTLRSE